MPSVVALIVVVGIWAVVTCGIWALLVAHGRRELERDRKRGVD